MDQSNDIRVEMCSCGTIFTAADASLYNSVVLSRHREVKDRYERFIIDRHRLGYVMKRDLFTPQISQPLPSLDVFTENPTNIVA